MFGAKTLNLKEGGGGARGGSHYVIERNRLCLRELLRDKRQPRGLVPFASVRFWRQEGSVGFEDDTVDIHVGDEIPPVRTWVGERAADANGKPNFLRAQGLVRGAAETVKHTTYQLCLLLSQDPNGLFLCSSRVNHEGLSKA